MSVIRPRQKEAIDALVIDTRRQAFLEAAEMAEAEAALIDTLEWPDAKARADSIRAIERKIRAKAEEE